MLGKGSPDLTIGVKYATLESKLKPLRAVTPGARPTCEEVDMTSISHHQRAYNHLLHNLAAAPEDGEDECVPCAYCGLPAESVDHVIPRSLRYMLTELGGWRDRWGRVADTVPCCRECNSVAGALVFNTMAEKRKYIHERLRIRYADLLRTPQWDEDELDALGPSLRGYVNASKDAANIVRQRLAWTGKSIRERIFGGQSEPAVDDAEVELSDERHTTPG